MTTNAEAREGHIIGMLKALHQGVPEAETWVARMDFSDAQWTRGEAAFDYVSALRSSAARGGDGELATMREQQVADISNLRTLLSRLRGRSRTETFAAGSTSHELLRRSEECIEQFLNNWQNFPIMTLLASQSEVQALRGEVERLTLGPDEEEAAILKELYSWTGSAFLAGEERGPIEAERKTELYRFLCRLIGWFIPDNDPRSHSRLVALTKAWKRRNAGMRARAETAEALAATLLAEKGQGWCNEASPCIEYRDAQKEITTLRKQLDRAVEGLGRIKNSYLGDQTAESQYNYCVDLAARIIASIEQGEGS